MEVFIMNHGNNEPYWMVKTGNYVLIYNITYSMNPHFTEYELWEYGNDGPFTVLLGEELIEKKPNGV